MNVKVIKHTSLNALPNPLPYDQTYYDREATKVAEETAEAEATERTGKIWRIEPVGPLEFIERYIGTKSLSKAQKGVIKGIFGDDPGRWFFAVEQAILRVGQGGGKNYIISRIMVYSFYLWSCLEDPHAYFGLAHNEPFDVLSYSQVNAQQAKNVFFRSLGDIIRMTKDPISGNNWFAEHMGFRLKQFGRGDIKDKELVIPNRNELFGDIHVYSLDTTAKSVEGYTIWISIMDEPSRANSSAKYAVAKQQYMTAYSNQQTRFTNPHHRLTIMFAYPEQEVNDLLVETFEIYSQFPKENKMEIVDGVLTAWYATYVFNKKDRAEKKAAYKKAYLKDPIDADRRWRAIVPPNVYGFFMPHFGKINDCANPNLISPVQFKEAITRREETVKGEKKIVNYSALELLKVTGDHRDRWWGADFATNKDRLVIAGGYAEKLDRDVETFTYTIRTDEGEEVIKETTIDCRPVIDIILIWEAKKPGWVIDYQNVEDIIMVMLRDHFPRSRALHFDMWNTESIRQKVLDIGVGNCEKLSFSNPMQLLYARMVRHLVWNNAMEYLDNDLLQKEMHQLILEGNHKIDHPDGGSKDLWDATSIATNLIVKYGSHGSRLNIDTGEGTEEDVDKELDQMLVLFDKAYKDYVDTNQRKPSNNAEMRIWLRARYKVEWSEAIVDMIYQTWVTWVNTLNAKISKMGIERSGRVSPQRATSGMESLADEIEEELRQKESDLQSDLREINKPGNLIF